MYVWRGIVRDRRVTCLPELVSRVSQIFLHYFKKLCEPLTRITSSETQGQIKGTRESLNGRKNVARRKVKNGEKSPWGQCLTRPVPNGRCRSGGGDHGPNRRWNLKKGRIYLKLNIINSVACLWISLKLHRCIATSLSRRFNFKVIYTIL